MWTLYLLFNSKLQRSYIGITTNVNRRLRQHNGEIKGGAKSTCKGKGSWYIVSMIEGFKNRSEAMRWEKLVKSRCRGLAARDLAMQQLIDGICPEGKKKYEVPTGLLYTLL